jgi:hypothetical protein
MGTLVNVDNLYQKAFVRAVGTVLAPSCSRTTLISSPRCEVTVKSVAAIAGNTTRIRVEIREESQSASAELSSNISKVPIHMHLFV